jgi:hypothetical protein
MWVDDLKLQEYKNKIKRQIRRNEIRIEDYENRKENLSEHGHWGLGYYTGVNSTLEKILDDLEELNEVK